LINNYNKNKHKTSYLHNFCNVLNQKQDTVFDVYSYKLDYSKIIIHKKNKHKNFDNHNLLGLGKVFIEFTRLDTATTVLNNFKNRIFEGRTITVRFYSLKSYQRIFLKRTTPVTYDEKIQLSLKTQERLMFSNVKLFQGLKNS